MPEAWLNRNVIGLAINRFLSDFGQEAGTSVLPLLLAAIGAPAIALGLIEGTADALSSFAKPFGGWLGDRVQRRKPWAAAGYVLTGVTTGLYGLLSWWPWTLLVRTVGWAGRGLRSPLHDALLANSVPASAAGACIRVRRSSRHRRRSRSPAGCPGNPWVYRTGRAIGIALYALHNFLYAVGSYPAGVLADRFGKGGFLLAAYALAALMNLILIVAAPTIASLVVVFALAGAGYALQQSLERAIAADLAPVEVRSTAFGALASANGVGDFVSSAIVGTLWTMVSPTAGFWYALILSAAGAVLTSAALRGVGRS